MIQKYTKTNAKTLKIFLFFTGLCTYHLSGAQSYLGLQHSNYGGIHQANLNPANIAGSRHKFYINGFTMGVNLNNDYMKVDLPFSIIKLLTNQVPQQYHKNNDPKQGIAFQDAWFKEDVNGKSKNVNLSAQIKMPGFMFTLPKGFAVGLQYKYNLSVQLNDVAEPLARLAKYGVDSSNGTTLYSGPNTYKVGENFKDNAFTININSWGEWDATIAKVLVEEEHMTLKAGFTGKYLMGYGTGYIKNNGLEFKVLSPDSVQFGHTDVEYGYTDPEVLKKYTNVSPEMIFAKASGAGFGYDFGATFQYTPEGTKRIINENTNYLIRAGISLLDGGNIKYKNQIRTTHITNIPGSGFKIGPDFASAWMNGSTQGLKYTDSTMRKNFNIDTTLTVVKTKMPTTINMQFDYNVFKFFFVGANLSQDLRGKKNIGIRRASYLTVIPRIESKFVELALPIGLMNDYKTGRVGFYFRIGPVFFGSDNLVSQLKSSNFYGADFYFGFSSGLLSKKAKKKNTSAS